MGYIYKVINTVTGKQYVGQTSRTIKVRWKEHVMELIKHAKGTIGNTMTNKTECLRKDG